MEEWINDATYHCDTCDSTFKVYKLDNEPVVNFCPCCGSRNIEEVDD